MTEKSIVPVTNDTWQTIMSIAPVAQASRMFGITEQQAAIVMLKGYELGLGLASSFEFIHVIDGKPGLSPKGALALIYQSGELDSLEIEDKNDSKGNPASCRVTISRTNGFFYTAEFSMDDAKKAGIVKPNSGWDKYPANMLRWRAVGYCADVVFPDVIGGMYRPEELGAAVNEDGEPVEIIDVTPKPADNTPTTATQTADVSPKTEVSTVVESPKKILVQDIIAAGFTAEQIMAANEGRIPATSEDCETVLGKLKNDAT